MYDMKRNDYAELSLLHTSVILTVTDTKTYKTDLYDASASEFLFLAVK